MKLPIELIPNTNPPRFRWRRCVVAPNGGRYNVVHEGTVPTTIETSLVNLIINAEHQEREIEKLRNQVQGHADRIAAQSEIIAKQAEKQTAPATTGSNDLPQEQPKGKRGRGG